MELIDRYIYMQRELQQKVIIMIITDPNVREARTK